MAPALVRFYGGSRKDWQATPWGEAVQFYQAIPRIRAQESGMPDAGIAGFDFEKLLKDVGEISPPVAPKPNLVKSPAELKARLAGMGIKVDIQ